MGNEILTGFQFAVESVKSFIIPMAIIEKEISIENGLQLSRLEIVMQVSNAFCKDTPSNLLQSPNYS